MRRWATRLAVSTAVVAVALAGFAILAWRAPIEPVPVPAVASFDASLVARGQALAQAGYCVTCHTAPGGRPYAGGLPMATGFGTVYSTNITPDPATGIGSWSLQAFDRALRQGVARDGSHLFPAFPYDHYTRVSDDDVKAMYAFLMTQPAVSHASTPSTLPFPLNIRLLQAGWKWLFFKEGRFQPDAGRSAEWNRGAYLAEGVSHCSACHSPRNALGAEKTGADARFSGAMVDGWFAPALTAANTSPVAWSAAEVHDYLRLGGTAHHGVAAGPMSEIVHAGYALPDDSDVRAVATYIASLNGSADREDDAARIVANALSRSRYDAMQSIDHGGPRRSPVHRRLRALPLQPRVGAATGAARAGAEELGQRCRPRQPGAGDRARHQRPGRRARTDDAGLRRRLVRRRHCSPRELPAQVAHHAAGLD